MGTWQEVGIQIMTVATTYFLMSRLSENVVTKVVATLIYVICPYRTYLQRDSGDMGRLILFALLPLLIAFVYELTEKHKGWFNLLPAAICLGVMAYADVVITCFIVGFLGLYLVYRRAWHVLIFVLSGLLLGGVKYLELIRYLLTGESWQDVSLAGIMPGAYTLGRYLSTYFYPAGKPGIGILLMGVLMLLLWLVMTDAEYHLPKPYRFALFTVVMTGFMASVWFPWDIIQRVSVVFLRFVPLIGELNVFVGMMSLGISILSTDVLDKFIKKLK